MKKILIAFAILFVVIACKNEDNIINIDTEPNEISLLRADFEKQTGYNYSKEYLLTPAFRTKVNWETAVQKGKDTVLINAAVLDSVLFPINGSQIDLKNNVILKAVRNKKSEWSYVTVTFIPTSLVNGYSGMILSRSLSNNVEKIHYYNNGSVIDNSITIAKKFANSGIKAQSGSNSKLRAGCKYAYVNGVLNSITCTPPEKGGLLDDEDPGLGQPGDYFPPGHGGGGGTGNNSSSAAQAFNEAIDDTNLPDCMKQVLAALKNLNGNTVADIIKKFAGEVPGYNWKVTFSDKTMDLTQFAGTDLVYLTDKGQVTTVLNSDPIVFKYTSDLSLAKTLIHESIHAYLTTLYYTDRQVILESYPEMLSKFLKQHKKPENDVQHDILVKYFISDIAKTLKSYGTEVGYRLTDQFYSDLAWGGLLNTRAFSQLPEQDRLRIKGTVNSEQYGNNVSTNGQTQKGKKMDCNN